MVIAWKVPKFGIVCKVAPFLKSAHITYPPPPKPFPLTFLELPLHPSGWVEDRTWFESLDGNRCRVIPDSWPDLTKVALAQLLLEL